MNQNDDNGSGAVAFEFDAQRKVQLVNGDLARALVDALVVPQFPDVSSNLGIGKVLRWSGGEAGMQAYQREITKNGPRPLTSVFLTDAGELQAAHMLHVAMIDDGAGRKGEFERVHEGFYNALSKAEEKNIRRVGGPALGTGNHLSGKESAQAMLSALYRFTKAYPDSKMEITIAIYHDEVLLNTFRDVLISGSYKNIAGQEILGQQAGVASLRGRKVSELFNEEPEQWGFRGDPYLWRELKQRFKDIDMPESRQALSNLFEFTYETAVGRPLANPENELFVHISRFVKTDFGMSRGAISPSFWQEKGFPLLLARYDALFPSASPNKPVATEKGTPSGHDGPR